MGLRILVVVHDFRLGGAERIALRLAGAWAASGHRVTVAAGSGEGPLRAVLADEVAVETPRRPIRRSFTRRRLGRFVTGLVRADRPDIVFLPGNYYWDVAVALALGMRDPPPIVGKVSNAVVRPGEPRLRALARIGLMRIKSRFLTRVALMHPAFLPEAEARLGGPRSRFAVVPQPVLDDGPPPRAVPPADDLVAVGRLEPQKNLSVLLQAFARLPADRRLAIYGDGPFRGRLEEEARALSIAERVRFAGYVPDVRARLAGARLLALSSDYEGFPSAVVEALAAGLPVVATDCSPAMTALVPSTAGRIVPPRDADALTREIAAVLDRPRPDPAALARLAEPYRLARSAEVYADLFARVATRGDGR